MVRQLQADVMGIDIQRPTMREKTALGVAFAAGFATAVWKEFDELREINEANSNTFKPRTDEAARTAGFELWTRAVTKAQGWIDVEDGADTDGDEDPQWLMVVVYIGT